MSVTSFSIKSYDLAATLTSGQAFRWRCLDGKWEGVIGARWVRLAATEGKLVAETEVPTTDWRWLTNYLQLEEDLGAVLVTFPVDEVMAAAVAACAGLRLLRQPLWECLASFILSSNKQIVHIRQIIALLCERLGPPLAVPSRHGPIYGFPSPDRVAQCSVADLRECKMGFRAPYLKETATMIAEGVLSLDRLKVMSCAEAREELMRFPGVGRKIADCVLLFAYGYPSAFPLDVWVKRALRQLYFPDTHATDKELERFSQDYFGPFAGYAQQYLFHYMRTSVPPFRRGITPTHQEGQASGL